ncbi:hypothetical protein B1207_05125 [Legionella quinlivanii]|uniref:Uncharacterized protein n=1 Tax=Legionella quinlivanii TaxID=45073 RepID=A0A364LLJ4_9GAMM|nr:hypothetical protein [Legionella quinlivanii]RAP37556.1 hypothetical protein B1207_05125 [Legionella quinlivanii]
MTISMGQLKLILDEFAMTNQHHEPNSKSEQLAASLASLTRNIKNPEQIVDAELKAKVIRYIDQFWQWAVANITGASWGENPQVGSWLSLQNNLESNGFKGVYQRHYPFFFARHSERFYNAEQSFSLEQVLALFKATARVLGYIRVEQMENHPFARFQDLQAQIEKGISTQHPILVDATNLFACLFYLLHFHLNKEQIALLPMLIRCRPETTDEERHSETALFISIYGSSALCSIQIASLKEYLDYLTVRSHEATKPLLHVLPPSLLALWNVFAEVKQKPAALPLAAAFNNDLLKVNSSEGKAKQVSKVENQQAFERAMNFVNYTLYMINTIKLDHPNNVIQQLYQGCLQYYMDTRQNESRSIFSFTPFSDKAKCQVAAQLQQDRNAQLGFFSGFTSQQGRLGVINKIFETAFYPVSEKSSNTAPRG